MRMSLLTTGPPSRRAGRAWAVLIAGGLLLAIVAQSWERRAARADAVPAPVTGPAFAPARVHARGPSVAAMSVAPLHQAATDAPGLPTPQAAASELRALIEGHLLNAFLVPVLDDEHDPPRFADPTLGMACGTGARVEVDGQVLRPGAIQGGRFRLRWTLDHCLPFGSGGPAFDGVAELDVARDATGLRAGVRLDGVRVERAGVAITLAGHWSVSTP